MDRKNERRCNFHTHAMRCYHAISSADDWCYDFWGHMKKAGTKKHLQWRVGWMHNVWDLNSGFKRTEQLSSQFEVTLGAQVYSVVDVFVKFIFFFFPMNLSRPSVCQQNSCRQPVSIGRQMLPTTKLDHQVAPKIHPKSCDSWNLLYCHSFSSYRS